MAEALADLFVPLDVVAPPDPAEAQPLPALPTEKAGVLSLSPAQEGRLLRQLRAHYDEALTGREEMLQRREMRSRRYLADPTLRQGHQPWDDAPQIFLPLTRRTIEVLKDEFTEAQGGIEAISVKGIGEEDVALANKKTRFLRHALREYNPVVWEDLLDQAEHDALLHGLGLFKVYPYQHPFPVPGADGQLLQTIVRIDVIDEGTMLLPPNHTGFQWPECSYIGQQLWPTTDEFPSMRQRGFTLPDLEAVEAGAGVAGRQYTEDENKLLEFSRVGLDPEQASEEFNPTVEMVEAYELFALTEGGDREFVVVHWFPHLRNGTHAAMSGQLARVMRLKDAMKQTVFDRPMWPFLPLTAWQQPRQARGLNVPDRLEGPQDILNRLSEQMIAQGEIDILPYVFANVALSGDLPNLRRIRPGDVVPLDNMGSVTFSPRQSNTRHYIEQMQMPRLWAEEDMGVTAQVQGRASEVAASESQKTLGGLSLQLQQSQKGFKKQIHHQARQVRQVLKLYLGLWGGHVQPTLTIPMPDEEGLEQRLFEGQPAVEQLVQVGPSDLGGPFDLVVQVNPEAHLEQQKRIMLAERLDALLAPIWPLGRRELWKHVWESMGLQEFERFYPESVATVETLMIVLRAQLQIASLEAMLMQAGQVPGQIPGVETPPGMPGQSPGDAAPTNPFAGLFGGGGGDMAGVMGGGGMPGEAPQTSPMALPAMMGG